MVLSIFTLGIFSGVQGGPPIERLQDSTLPKIIVRQDRSLYDIPDISITFPNGRQDELILEKHFPNEEARLANEEHCNYFGHLKNDPEACVAVTGCYGRDDLEFTVMSEHVLGPNMFVLQKDGQFRGVENDKAFLNSHIENESEMESRWQGIVYLSTVKPRKWHPRIWRTPQIGGSTWSPPPREMAVISRRMVEFSMGN